MFTKTAMLSFMMAFRKSLLFIDGTWSCQYQLVLGRTGDRNANKITILPLSVNYFGHEISILLFYYLASHQVRFNQILALNNRV